jgi:iron complex outermembrane receptor protein
LPLIPANSLRNTLRIEFGAADGQDSKGYAFMSLKNYFRQDRVSDFETPTAGYSLLDMGYGCHLMLFRHECELRITANNIFDKAYVSHLSRLKPDGIANMGRTISVGLSVGL